MIQLNDIANKALAFLLLLVFTIPSFSQNHTVARYQKINETNGGFSGSLDDFDSWGVAIDNIGDLDGNGSNDLAVGAFRDDDGGFNRGAVWILFLNAENEVISQTKISDTSGNFTGVLDDDDQFGGSVAYLGDLNSDGLIELAVGALYDGDGGHWHGAVWILSLNNDGTVNSHVKISDTVGGFTGLINGDAVFGTDVENIGDLNNDGITDLAVGSRRDADGGSRRGAVWILFMNANLTVNSYQKISDTQGGFTPVLDFEDYFGGAVLNMGDQDGDGVTDLIVGSYRDDDQFSNSGSFYALFLNSDGTVKSSQKVSNLSGGISNPISSNALFGVSIDGTNDIDNDGRKEIFVGGLGHLNPTLSVPTGGFHMIELNFDGTVSEDYFYSYGEHCFSGVLDGGDYFGGAITMLNGGENPKIAVSAYHDSENGPERGAIWILDLGEVSYSISDSSNPSGCLTFDGSYTISNLSYNKDYIVAYEYEGNVVTDYFLSDSNGDIIVDNLNPGIYSNITVTESVIDCSDDLGEVILSNSTLDARISIIEPSECGRADGQILIDNLIPNQDYTISFEDQNDSFSFTETADSNGEIVVRDLYANLYRNLIVSSDQSGCQSFFGNVTLENPDFQLQLVVAPPSSCNIPDGSLQITGLTPGTDYEISYIYNGIRKEDVLTSNASGEIVVTSLNAGDYENVAISSVIGNCTYFEPHLALFCEEDSELCFTVKKFFTPNGDGVDDHWFLEPDGTCEITTQIYDRYGRLIVTLTPDKPHWDGRYHGKPMPSSDYWCSVRYTNGTISNVYRFNFALKR